MTNTFTFRLVSPEAEVMNVPAWEVSVPGVEGDFGVRAGHMPLISALRPGVVTVQAEEGATPTRFFIAGGFANVNAAECSVMAENVTDIRSLKADQVLADIETLQSRLETDLDAVSAAQLRAELAIAQARYQAARAAA